jgi:hypothetical protein
MNKQLLLPPISHAIDRYELEREGLGTEFWAWQQVSRATPRTAREATRCTAR